MNGWMENKVKMLVYCREIINSKKKKRKGDGTDELSEGFKLRRVN